MESHVTFANNIGKYSKNFFSLCVNFLLFFLSFLQRFLLFFTLYSFLFYISRVGRWNSMKDILLFFRLFFFNFYFSPFFTCFFFAQKIHLINFSFSASNFWNYLFYVLFVFCRLFGKSLELSRNTFHFFLLYLVQMNSLVISLQRISCNYQFTKHMSKMMWWLVYLSQLRWGGKNEIAISTNKFQLFLFRFPLNHRFFRVITRKRERDDDDFVGFKDSFGFFLSSLWVSKIFQLKIFGRTLKVFVEVFRSLFFSGGYCNTRRTISTLSESSVGKIAHTRTFNFRFYFVKQKKKVFTLFSATWNLLLFTEKKLSFSTFFCSFLLLVKLHRNCEFSLYLFLRFFWLFSAPLWINFCIISFFLSFYWESCSRNTRSRDWFNRRFQAEWDFGKLSPSSASSSPCVFPTRSRSFRHRVRGAVRDGKNERVREREPNVGERKWDFFCTIFCSTQRAIRKKSSDEETLFFSVIRLHCTVESELNLLGFHAKCSSGLTDSLGGVVIPSHRIAQN